MSIKLYHAVNDVLAHIVLHDGIDVGHTLIDRLSEVLEEMDGGVYDPNFGKRTRKPKPAPTDLLQGEL